MTKINSQSELREAVTLLNNHVISLCNASNYDDIAHEYVEAHEILTEILKAKVEFQNKS